MALALSLITGIKKVIAILLIIIILLSGVMIVVNVLWGPSLQNSGLANWQQVYDYMKDNGFHNETAGMYSVIVNDPQYSGTFENTWQTITNGNDLKDYMAIILATEHVLDLYDQLQNASTPKEVQDLSLQISETYLALDAAYKMNDINPLNNLDATSVYNKIAGTTLAQMAGADPLEAYAYGAGLDMLIDANPFNNNDAWMYLLVAGIGYAL